MEESSGVSVRCAGSKCLTRDRSGSWKLLRFEGLANDLYGLCTLQQLFSRNWNNLRATQFGYIRDSGVSACRSCSDPFSVGYVLPCVSRAEGTVVLAA
jgi:hypothetical protein